MESYGELLKKKRESKELDLDKASREISIDKKYLVALEDEDNSVFPGEAYLIGFLRNYSEYLELDSAFVMQLYHNKKTQESPIPENLIIKRKSPWAIIAVVSGIVIILAAIIGISIWILNRNNDKRKLAAIEINRAEGKKYELDNTKFVQRVYKGDQLIIPSASGKIILTVRETLSSFAIDIPSGVFYSELAEESEIDTNGDSVPDLILYVSDISSTDETRGAEISVLLRNNNYVSSDFVYAEDIPLESEVKSKYPQKVIIEDNRAYPFTINASFRDSCLFRDKIDRNESVETNFTRGEVFTATANNSIRLWISNNSTVKISIIADSRIFDLDIGVVGQVFVEDIKWIKDTDGKFKLVVIELD